MRLYSNNAPGQWSQSHSKTPGSSANIQYAHLRVYHSPQFEEERITVHGIFSRAIEATRPAIPEIRTGTTQARIGSIHLLRTCRKQFPPTFKCALHNNYPSMAEVSEACNFVWRQSKNCAVSFSAVPARRRAPTLAIVPLTIT